jgi:hypothetical protein
MSSTMWLDEGDNWILLDELQAAIHRRYYSPEEVIWALATCIGKIIAQADSPKLIAEMRRAIDSTIDFQTSMEGTEDEPA